LNFLVDELSKALSIVSRIAATRSYSPILAGVRIDGNDQGFSLTATDLEVAVRVGLPEKSDSQFVTVPPAKFLHEVVSSCPSGVVSIDVDGDSLSISSGMYQSRIKCFDPADFPGVTFGQSGVPVPGLISAIRRVMPFAATSSGRPQLEGVYLGSSEDGTIVAAADGFRFAVETLPVKTEISAILSLLSLRKVVGFLDEVSLSFDNSRVYFEGGDIDVCIAIVDGKFPDLFSLVPEECDTYVTLDKDELGGALKRVQILAREAANMVTLDIGTGNVTLTTVSAEAGECQEDVSAEVQGPETTIFCNVNFMRDIVKAIRNGTVTLGLRGPTMPIVVQEEGFVSVMMPMA
jgi:DNA polymerase-3 subunit beta